MDMIERFAHFQKCLPEWQRADFWADLCDADRSRGNSDNGRDNGNTEASPESPAVFDASNPPAREAVLEGTSSQMEDAVAIDALSDKALESVAGGLGVLGSGDTPGKLREAAYCYLADAASEEAAPFVT